MAEAEVTCNYCDQSGTVIVHDVVGKTAEYEDRIPHLESCSIRKKLESAALPTRQPRHLKKKRWVKQERRAAEKLGLHATPASGALGEDGDAREFHGIRLECKGTDSDRFSLSQAVWSKLVTGARRADEIPVLQVELRGSAGLCRFYIFAQGSYAMESQEHKQKSVRRGLHLRRTDQARTPFHVTALDPVPVVVTERQLLEAIRATE